MKNHDVFILLWYIGMAYNDSFRIEDKMLSIRKLLSGRASVLPMC